ncbi:spherulin-2A-like, partial [Cydia amplana]|uniref:spherulin-2A-like n=1 Tax=Cydia amplana TaxID=1869771 RepID=UPI002FE653B4
NHIRYIPGFNITSSNLKAAVRAHAGGTPLDVFLKSPTPWGDLYKTYNWPEVKRNTKVKRVKIDVKADVENYVKNNYTGKHISMAADYNIDLVIGFNLLMPPSQTAEFILNATKINMDVLIDYESSLIGDVAANYNPRHEGHHFWAYDVKAIVESVSKMSAIQKGTDLLNIEFFTDAFGYVIDQDTGKIIKKVSADYIF